MTSARNRTRNHSDSYTRGEVKGHLEFRLWMWGLQMIVIMITNKNKTNNSVWNNNNNDNVRPRYWVGSLG